MVRDLEKMKVGRGLLTKTRQNVLSLCKLISMWNDESEIEQPKGARCYSKQKESKLDNAERITSCRDLARTYCIPDSPSVPKEDSNG